MRIIRVTFVTRRQNKNPQLTFPRRVASLLGLRSRKHVRVVIRKKSGQILLDDKVPLRSGTEIYGPKVKAALQTVPKQDLWIDAWRPLNSQRKRKRRNKTAGRFNAAQTD